MVRRLRLREWRERRALSQAELAAAAGLAKGTIVGLERPNPRQPHPSTVRKLAAALGVEPPELWAPASPAAAGDYPAMEDQR